MAMVLHKIVGKVSYTRGSGVTLNLDPAWVAANIGTVHIPQLKGVPTYGGVFSGNVRFYKRAIPQLKAAFEEVERAGLKSKIIFWAGSFVPRLMRGGSTPSNHTFATAFDVNPDQNGFRRTPAAVGAHGDLHGVAAIFKRFGFTWGGDWKGADGMHFEINRIMSAAEIAAARGASTPVAPEKASAKIILVTKGAEDELVYHHLKTASHAAGKFYADKGEILSVLFGGGGRVPVAEYLQNIGTPEFAPRGNHLNDPKEPRIYLFVDTK